MWACAGRCLLVKSWGEESREANGNRDSAAPLAHPPAHGDVLPGALSTQQRCIGGTSTHHWFITLIHQCRWCRWCSSNVFSTHDAAAAAVARDSASVFAWNGQVGAGGFLGKET